MPDSNPTKLCRKCSLQKPLSDMTKRVGSKDGYRPTCKSCLNSLKRKYFANSEKARTYKKKYRQSPSGREANLKGGRKFRLSEKYLISTRSQEFLERRRVREKNSRKNNPVPYLARRKVKCEIKKGKLLHPTLRQCINCKEKAVHYHHYAGYAKENWLNIVPVCMPCHVYIHNQ